MEINEKEINKIVNIALLSIIFVMAMDNLYLQLTYNFTVNIVPEILFFLSTKKFLMQLI